MLLSGAETFLFGGKLPFTLRNDKADSAKTKPVLLQFSPPNSSTSRKGRLSPLKHCLSCSGRRVHADRLPQA